MLDEGRQLSCYLYDANGDRTYKFTGEYTAQNQSGQWHYYYLVDQPTLYASPYLVANRKGYTKHYYAESERIASRIGGGGLQEIGMEEEWQEELLASHQDRQDSLFEGLASCLDAEVRTAEDALKVLYDWHDSVHEEKECYWYHPDHLGSSSWITFTDGKAVQHLHYLPWGEDYVNQRTTDFSARFTFSAKEKDSETGLSYFGSRYYNSDLSIWLSVDPMAAKYPSLSPYVYCADNPVRLVDPNGEAWEVNQDGYIRQTGDENDHTLYVVNGKEQNFGDRLTYRHGKLKGQAISTPVDDEVMKSFTTNENGYSQMNLTGKEEAGLKMMRFFSSHTNVEWSFWGGNAWDNESNTESAYATIGTSHSYKEDKGSTPLVLNSSIKRNERHTTPLKFFIHTHPYPEVHGSWASGDDKLIRNFCQGENPSAQFGIIHRGILYDYGNNRIRITF